MFSETHSLLGSTSPHPMSYMMLSTCMLITTATRVAGLVLSMMYQHKILAILYPPRDITEEMSRDACEWLSVLGEEGLDVFKKHSMVYQQVDGEGRLMYTHRGWKVWETSGDLISMDTFHMQEGNLPYGYYCQDIRTIFSYHWLPLASWVILFILPPLLLSLSVLLFTFRSRCCSLIYSFPMYLLSGIISHLTIGPVHCSIKTPAHFFLSTRVSYINLLLTMAAVIILLSFISSPTNTLPIIVLGPLFLLSALLNIIFLLIYSPSSPSCSCSSPADKASRKMLVWQTSQPSNTAVKMKILI